VRDPLPGSEIKIVADADVEKVMHENGVFDFQTPASKSDARITRWTYDVVYEKVFLNWNS